MVKKQWLKDEEGNNIAPKTTLDQILMNSGTKFIEDYKNTKNLIPTVIDTLESSSSSSALSAKQGKNLQDKITQLSENKDVVIPISKADYDALPIDKFTDNKKYYIKDWNPAGGVSSSQLVVEWVTTEESSLAANATKNVLIDVAKEGYTPLGCVGWYIGGTGTTNCYTKQAYINSEGKFSAYLKNIGTSAVTPTIQAQILYIKNI